MACTDLADPLQSLNNQLASKSEDLQAQQERCDAKDEQIAGLAQQVEQLQGAAEAHKQAEAMTQNSNAHHWAVDVSLDQGMGTGLGSYPLMPTSPRALRQRMLVLEVGMLELKHALLFAASCSFILGSVGHVCCSLTTTLQAQCDCLRWCQCLWCTLLSVCLSACLPACLSACLSVCLPVCAHHAIVCFLQSANEKLEKALMAAHSQAPHLHAPLPAGSGQGMISP